MAARSIERDHQLGTRSLPQRMRYHECFEIRELGGVPAERELCVESLLQCAEAKLFEARDLCLGEIAVSELAERRPSPEGERPSNRGACPLGVAPGELSSPFLYEMLEAIRVELSGVDEQQVPVAGRLQPRGGLVAVRCAECAPQARDLDLHTLDGARGRMFSPECIGQAVDRNRLIGLQQQ